MYVWNFAETSVIRLRLAFGSLPDSVPEMFQVNTPNLTPPVMIRMDGRDTPMCFGQLPLQRIVKAPTTLPRFEVHNV